MSPRPGLNGEYWVVPGSAAEPRPAASFFSAGRTWEEMQEAIKTGFATAPDFVFDPAARILAQDKDGVRAEVMYASVGLALFRVEDDVLRQACFRAFNDWTAEYCAHDPKRLVGCAMIDVDDPHLAAAEIRRVAGSGLRAAMITGMPIGATYDSPDYDPMWAAAQECGVPLTLHVHTNRKQTHAAGIIENVTHAINDVAESMAYILFGGVFDRFPQLRVILAEVDVSWIPHFLYRTDRWAKKTATGKHLKRTPSEYMRSNVWATFLDEGATIPFAAELYGADRLLWATDFPHFNSAFPDSAKVAAESLAGVSPADKVKITVTNAIDVYSL
jgi:predicted TIM-barrel fold metal-dependent hydrolase